MEKTRYIALTATGGHVGTEVQARTYAHPEHAAMACPKGRVYVASLIAEATYDQPDPAGRERVKIEAQMSYPLTLQAVRVPGLGAQAEGAFVLRDLGPGHAHRWAVQFRNDQCGGYGNSQYHDDYGQACADFAETAARELAAAPVRAAHFNRAA